LKGGKDAGTITNKIPIGNGGSGSFDWNIPKDKPIGSDYKVSIQSTSQSRIKDTSDNNFNITQGNSPPVLNEIGNKIVTANQVLTIIVKATDPDGDLLTYSVSGLPKGAIFNANTHTFSWTPAKGSAGTYSVMFRVADPSGLADQETIKITVNDPIKTIWTYTNIVPSTLNLGSKGYFLAFVTLPDGYQGATIDMKTVSCSGAPAIRMIRTKIFPRTVGFVFRTSDLKGVESGMRVILSVKGELKNQGTTYPFTGVDSVKAISKPGWQADDIRDVSKVTDDQLLRQYSS
jgi:hypothetical protein